VARLLAIARGAWGAALLIAPDRFLARNEGQSSGSERAVARVLGARQLAEAGILVCAPERRPPIWAIAVDLIHAASMLAVGAASPTLRRDALRSAAIATALSALSASQR
jgi:hypothetical protein